MVSGLLRTYQNLALCQLKMAFKGLGRSETETRELLRGKEENGVSPTLGPRKKQTEKYELVARPAYGSSAPSGQWRPLSAWTPTCTSPRWWRPAWGLGGSVGRSFCRCRRSSRSSKCRRWFSQTPTFGVGSFRAKLWLHFDRCLQGTPITCRVEFRFTHRPPLTFMKTHWPMDSEIPGKYRIFKIFRKIAGKLCFQKISEF